MPSDTKRALFLYEVALSLVEAKGTAVRLGTTPFKEYRAGSLTIHWLPSSGYLDVWRGRKVLAIERLKGTLRVMRYLPDEEWEQELENAAKA